MHRARFKDVLLLSLAGANQRTLPFHLELLPFWLTLDKGEWFPLLFPTTWMCRTSIQQQLLSAYLLKILTSAVHWLCWASVRLYGTKRMCSPSCYCCVGTVSQDARSPGRTADFLYDKSPGNNTIQEQILSVAVMPSKSEAIYSLVSKATVDNPCQHWRNNVQGLTGYGTASHVSARGIAKSLP